MTLFFGELDSRERTLTWNSAGHAPVFHYRRREGRIDELVTTGPPSALWKRPNSRRWVLCRWRPATCF